MIIQCYFKLVFLHLRSCQTSASTSVNKLSGYSWRRTQSESVLGTRFGFDHHHHPRDYHDLDGDDHDQPHRQFHDHLDHLVTNVDSQLGICLNSAFDSQMPSQRQVFDHQGDNNDRNNDNHDHSKFCVRCSNILPTQRIARGYVMKSAA